MMWELAVWLLLFAAAGGFSDSGPADLRREVTTIKHMLTSIDSRLDQFHALFHLNLDKKVTDLEAKLEAIATKLEDLSGPSMDKLRQEITARGSALQRLARSLDATLRKVSGEPRKHEKLERVAETMHNLSKTFNTLCRKIDTLQKELEKERGPHFHGNADSEDFRTFLGLKLATLEMAASKMTKCIECSHSGVPMKEDIAGMLENVVYRLQNSDQCSDMEVAVAKIVENQIREIVKEFNIDMLRRFEKVNLLMDDLKAICEEKTTSSDNLGPPIELKKLEEAAQRISNDDSNKEAINPGRMFRKLWRRLTEPIQKIEAKIDSLKASYDYSSHRFCNETFKKLADWSDKDTYWESCVQNQQALHDATKEMVTKLTKMEQEQAKVYGACYGIGIGGTSVGSNTVINREPAPKVAVLTTVEPAKDAFEAPVIHHSFHPLSCADLQMQGISENGIYTIRPKNSPSEFLAYCDFRTDGGGYTVIQRRGDFGDTQHTNFTQDWAAYRDGFGDLLLEFWLGNEKIHLLSTQEPVRLRVELEDFEGDRAYAEYARFSVGPESDQYRLNIDSYSGNATDSLGIHDGKMFSTYDRDNDEVAACCNCATTFKGGWWYYKCFEANLNGPYHSNPTDNDYFQGIIWEKWRGDYSLRASEMKLRPLHFDRQL